MAILGTAMVVIHMTRENLDDMWFRTNWTQLVDVTVTLWRCIHTTIARTMVTAIVSIHTETAMAKERFLEKIFT